MTDNLKTKSKSLISDGANYEATDLMGGTIVTKMSFHGIPSFLLRGEITWGLIIGDGDVKLCCD